MGQAWEDAGSLFASVFWYMESSELCFFFQTVTKYVLMWAGFSVLGHFICIMTLWVFSFLAQWVRVCSP